MDIGDLTPDEDLALLSLMREIIQVDQQYSAAEREEVRKIKEAMGTERFDRAIRAAETKLATRAAVKEHAKTIERPGARALIFSLLEQIAKSDGVAPGEEKPLAWLASWWTLKSS